MFAEAGVWEMQQHNKKGEYLLWNAISDGYMYYCKINEHHTLCRNV